MNRFSSVWVVCCYKTISCCLMTYCVFFGKKRDSPVPMFMLFTCTKHQRRRAYSVVRLLSFVKTFATTLNFITFIVLFDLSVGDYYYGKSNIGSCHIRNISKKKNN